MYNYSLKANKYAERREEKEKSRRKKKVNINDKKTEKRWIYYTVLLIYVKIKLVFPKSLFEDAKEP